MFIVRVCVLTAFISLVSCKTTNLLEDKKKQTYSEEISKVFFWDSSYQYKIRKDDKLTLSVWGEDDLSVGSTYGIYNSNEVYGKWLMVDFNGNIEVPRLGTIRVEDKTIIELKDFFKKSFSLWIQNPVIDIKIQNREIVVLGEVKDPQVLYIDKEKNSLLEIISRCSGLDFYANAKSIKILRQVNSDVYVVNIDLSTKANYINQNINLHAGDIVIVPSKKNKEFDKRISTIIPFTTTVTAAAILMGSFK